MPNELSNLELDEVSLVGKAANGKKFLIFKSMQKSKGSITMKDQKPAGAKAGAGAAQVTKADIAEMISGEVQKAVKPLAEENAKLRKSLDRQVVTIRKRELEEIAKEHLGALGSTKETATILMSLEDSNMDGEAKTAILKTLKQANAAKREAMAVLGTQMGSSRPAPGSATAQFETIVEKHLSEIRKSDTEHKSAKVLRARAVTKAAEENPEMAKAVMGEHKQAVHAAFIGGGQ